MNFDDYLNMQTQTYLRELDEKDEYESQEDRVDPDGDLREMEEEKHNCNE